VFVCVCVCVCVRVSVSVCVCASLPLVSLSFFRSLCMSVCVCVSALELCFVLTTACSRNLRECAIIHTDLFWGGQVATTKANLKRLQFTLYLQTDGHHRTATANSNTKSTCSLIFEFQHQQPRPIVHAGSSHMS